MQHYEEKKTKQELRKLHTINHSASNQLCDLWQVSELWHPHL